MFLTQVLLKAKPGWRPRSLGVPGRQWIGKNKKVRHVTHGMKKRKAEKEAQVLAVERILEFPYLNQEEAKYLEEKEKERKAASKKLLRLQEGSLGPDVFGLGLGKPSHLDHLLTNDIRRYNPPEET